MRYSEISGLRRCDVHFCDSYLKLFIEKSKTDVYREGNWIYISKIQSELSLSLSRKRNFITAFVTWMSESLTEKRDKGFSLTTNVNHYGITEKKTDAF